MRAFGLPCAIIVATRYTQVFKMRTITFRTPPFGTRMVMLLGVLILGLLAVLLWLTLRRPPALEPWLYISPAAAQVDETTTLTVASSGWRSNERVAVCFTTAEAYACDADSAAQIETSDARGQLQARVLAGPALLQGHTEVLLLGLKSDRVMSRSFRALKPANASLASDATRSEPLPDQAVDIATPAAQTTGWQGEYFANPNLAGAPVLTRTEPELALQWGAGSPDPALPPDGFSARWTQRVDFGGQPQRLTVQANGAVRVRAGDALLLDRWLDDGSLAVLSADINLPAGQQLIQIEFADLAGDAALILSWQPLPLQTADWRGEYFTNPDMAGEPALVRNDPDPNLDWGDGSPDPSLIPVDGFSARWTRRIEFAPGVYRFMVTATDGARLLLNGQPVVDAWQGAAGQAMRNDFVVQGGLTEVTLHFRNLQGPARLAFGWSPVNTSAAQNVETAMPTPSHTPQAVAVSTPSSVAPLTPVATTTSLLSATPTATSTPGNGQTATASAATASATAPATATPGPSATATATSNGAATATPTSGSAATALPTATTASTAAPPGSTQRTIDMNPPLGSLGQEITVTSGNWSPGIVLRVALAEYGKPYTQATDLSGVSFTTPLDSSQSWSFRFTFPSTPPWSTQVYPVQVWVHSATWSEWGYDLFEIETP